MPIELLDFAPPKEKATWVKLLPEYRDAVEAMASWPEGKEAVAVSVIDADLPEEKKGKKGFQAIRAAIKHAGAVRGFTVYTSQGRIIITRKSAAVEAEAPRQVKVKSKPTGGRKRKAK